MKFIILHEITDTYAFHGAMSLDESIGYTTLRDIILLPPSNTRKKIK